MEEWIKQGGFIAVIGVLLIGVYYFKGKVDALQSARDKDAEVHLAQLDKLRTEYITLLQDVLKTIGQNTVAIDTVGKAMDITLKLERLANGLRETPK